MSNTTVPPRRSDRSARRPERLRDNASSSANDDSGVAAATAKRVSKFRKHGQGKGKGKGKGNKKKKKHYSDSDSDSSVDFDDSSSSSDGSDDGSSSDSSSEDQRRAKKKSRSRRRDDQKKRSRSSSRNRNSKRGGHSRSKKKAAKYYDGADNDATGNEPASVQNLEAACDSPASIVSEQESQGSHQISDKDDGNGKGLSTDDEA